jgi:hypothetical protein
MNVPNEYSDPARHNEPAVAGKNRNANIFRMMAHSPNYLEQYCRLGGAIRHKGELDPIVRELAITRTGSKEAPWVVAHCGSARTLAHRRAERSPENWRRRRASTMQRHRLCRNRRATSRRATFRHRSKLTPAALVELQLSVGFTS